MMLHDRLDRLVCLLVIVYVWWLVRARFGLGLSLLTRAFCQAGEVLDGFIKLLLDAFSGIHVETVGY
jgi:hypothetical protein